MNFVPIQQQMGNSPLDCNTFCIDDCFVLPSFLGLICEVTPARTSFVGQRDADRVLVGRERRRRWSANDKLQIVREAFAPGARVALVARRRDVSRSQIYRWRATLREGRLDGSGGEVVGFVPVQMPMAPSVAPNAPIPAMDSFAGGSVIEIGLAGGRCLRG